MRTQFDWIDLPIAGRLAVIGRPRAGDWLDDEISGWRAAGINVVVSLLEQEEVRELGIGREADLCREQGIEFISFPVPDRAVPAAFRETMALSQSLAAQIGQGKAFAVHCRAGIGRSPLIAACILVCLRFDVDAAFEKISQARGVRVPDTPEQREWVMAFRDAVATASPIGGTT
jgi:protein-tyrosine phosphatase